MRILEPGLWSRSPEALYELELRLIEKQGADFRLLAPDEPDARAAFEAEHPEQVDRRASCSTSVDRASRCSRRTTRTRRRTTTKSSDDEAVDDVGEAEVTA